MIFWRFRSLQEYWRRLVYTGHHLLERHGQTDDLGRQIVYLFHRRCYCSVTSVAWGDSFPNPTCGLFFWGWYRPARWWSAFPFWHWQTPSQPEGVTPDSCFHLRHVQVWQIRRVLAILQHSRVISAVEFHCATLLGAH